MPFIATEAVEPMDYDFTGYGGPKGCVPEPSQDEFRAYTRGMTKIQVAFREIEKEAEDPDLTEDQINGLADRAEKVGKSLDKLVGKLCKNQPSEEDVAKLPFRVKNEFSKWLQESFSPKA